MFCMSEMFLHMSKVYFLIAILFQYTVYDRGQSVLNSFSQVEPVLYDTAASSDQEKAHFQTNGFSC